MWGGRCVSVSTRITAWCSPASRKREAHLRGFSPSTLAQRIGHANGEVGAGVSRLKGVGARRGQAFVTSGGV
jgi:hypothetical protein